MILLASTVPLIFVVLLPRLAWTLFASNDARPGCVKHVIHGGSFSSRSTNATTPSDVSSFQQHSAHIEGKWVDGQYPLTFKVALMPSSDRLLPKFAVHLTNGRSLGSGGEDFNCYLDTAYVKECGLVATEPWCCYELARPEMMPLRRCSRDSCRRAPTRLCRGMCFDLMIFHVIFEPNVPGTGGSIKLAASFRKTAYLQSREPFTGEWFNTKEEEGEVPGRIHYKELKATNGGSPLNEHIAMGIWLKYDENTTSLEVGLEGRAAPQLQANLWDFFFEDNVSLNDERKDDVGWLGVELVDKATVFKPEYFATDLIGSNGRAAVGANCSDVIFSPVLQETAKGGICIESFQCPRGHDCLPDERFINENPHLQWLQVKTCRPNPSVTWQVILTTVLTCLMIVTFMVGLSMCCLICDKEERSPSA